VFQKKVALKRLHSYDFFVLRRCSRRRSTKVRRKEPMSVCFSAPSTTALLVLDIQRDFLRADGRLPVDQRRAPGLIDSVNAVIAAAESAGVLVVDIENAFSMFSVANIFRRFSAIKGSSGALPDERVRRGGVSLAKRSTDAFRNPKLKALLDSRGIRNLIVAGVHANGCVCATVNSALHRGYHVEVLVDGVASVSDMVTKRALAFMWTRGAFLAT
jgi:nicotinamidase-related amidase